MIRASRVKSTLVEKEVDDFIVSSADRSKHWGVVADFVVSVLDGIRVWIWVTHPQ
jgi:hypothetical protein